jgi:hypothetical protein
MFHFTFLLKIKQLKYKKMHNSNKATRLLWFGTCKEESSFRTKIHLIAKLQDWFDIELIEQEKVQQQLD